MNIFSLFKKALLHPQYLFPENRLPKRTIFLYFLLLSFIFSLPAIGQSLREARQIEQSIQQIVEKTPEFEIKNNQLVTDKKNASFIYQSDFLQFVFDPEDKLTTQDIKTSLIGNQIGLGYMKNHLVIAVNNSNPLINFMEGNTITINYKDIDQTYFSKTIFESTEVPLGQKALIVILMMLFILVPTMIAFAIYLLLGTLIGHTLERSHLLGLSFKNSYHLFIVAATLPVVVATIMSLMFPSLDSMALIIMVTVIIYSNIIRQVKKNIINSQNKEN